MLGGALIIKRDGVSYLNMDALNHYMVGYERGMQEYGFNDEFVKGIANAFKAIRGYADLIDGGNAE